MLKSKKPRKAKKKFKKNKKWKNKPHQKMRLF